MPIKKSSWLEHGAVGQPFSGLGSPGRDALVSDSPAENHMTGSHKRGDPRSLLGPSGPSGRLAIGMKVSPVKIKHGNAHGNKESQVRGLER